MTQAGGDGSYFGFSRPLKGTLFHRDRFPAVETAGYYQASRKAGLKRWSFRVDLFIHSIHSLIASKTAQGLTPTRALMKTRDSLTGIRDDEF